jgi:hypothetical protein
VNRDRPWCVVRSAGTGDGYELKFGCDDTEDFLGLVRSLKSRIDWRERRFDPGAKVWHVAPAAGDDLRLWLLAHFDAGQRRLVGVTLDDLGAASYRRPPPPPSGAGGRAQTSPYDVLWLRPGAPSEVVKAAYKALAFKHHPDKGGDTAAMQAINVAFEQLQKGAA